MKCKSKNEKTKKVAEVKEECCGCCCEEESSCCEEKEEDKGCKCSGCECLCER